MDNIKNLKIKENIVSRLIIYEKVNFLKLKLKYMWIYIII